jgi:hypothetical protein
MLVTGFLYYTASKEIVYTEIEMYRNAVIVVTNRSITIALRTVQ